MRLFVDNLPQSSATCIYPVQIEVNEHSRPDTLCGQVLGIYYLAIGLIVTRQTQLSKAHYWPSTVVGCVELASVA